MGRIYLAKVVVPIQILGLLLNALALYLITRQGFSTIDMMLAFVMAVCDFILMSEELIFFFFQALTGLSPFFKTHQFRQFDGFMVTSLGTISLLIVGYLALMRLWKIVLDRPIVARHWLRALLIQEGTLVVLLILVAMRGEFILSPFNRYHFLYVLSTHFSTILSLWALILWLAFTALSVSISYPAITYKYIKLIDASKLTYPLFYESNSNILRQKLLALARMAPLVMVYDAILTIPMFVLLKELVTKKIRSDMEDCLFTLALLALPIANPLILILLHEDTSSDLKRIIKRLMTQKV